VESLFEGASDFCSELSLRSGGLQILLVGQMSVSRQEYIESGMFRGAQEFAILQCAPAALKRGFDLVFGQKFVDAERRTLIEKDSHQRTGAGDARLLTSNSRTARICSRVRRS